MLTWPTVFTDSDWKLRPLPSNRKPGTLRPSGFCPVPLSVLCAILNHEPPEFLVSNVSANDAVHACPSARFLLRSPPFNGPRVIGINAGTSPHKWNDPYAQRDRPTHG